MDVQLSLILEHPPILLDVTPRILILRPSPVIINFEIIKSLLNLESAPPGH